MFFFALASGRLKASSIDARAELVLSHPGIAHMVEGEVARRSEEKSAWPVHRAGGQGGPALHEGLLHDIFGIARTADQSLNEHAHGRRGLAIQSLDGHVRRRRGFRAGPDAALIGCR